VTDVILGRPVSGTSETRGRLEMGLLPNSKGVMAQLQFRGTSYSNTTAFDRWAQIHSYAVTQIESQKNVLFDQRGTELSPTQTAAETRSVTTGISTNQPRLRGKLVVCLTERGVERKRAQVDRISASHAEVRISRDFDRAVDEQLQQVRKDALAEISRIRTENALPQVEFRFSSTPEALQVVVLRPGGDRHPMVTPPLPRVTMPDFQIHLHANLVHRIWNDPQLRARLGPLFDMIPTFGAAALSMLMVDSAEGEPVYESRWSEDENWLILISDADGLPSPPPRPALNVRQRANCW
jgi:hypothetical protein